MLTASAVARAIHPGLIAADLAGPKPAGEISNVAYARDGSSSSHLDLYRPSGTPPAGGWPVVVAFPGGGWRWASRAQLGHELLPLVRAGFAVAAADYTFAGTQLGTKVWPANFEDVRNAVRYIRSHAGRLGLDPDHIAALGDSAGANLASLVGTFPDGAINLDGVAHPNAAPPTGVSARVQAVVDFYGPTDLAQEWVDTPRPRGYLDTFLGGSLLQVPGRYEAASPLNYVSPESPPFLILQGAKDQVVPPEQSIRLSEALTRNGVMNRLIVAPNVGHGFLFNAGGMDVLPAVIDFLNTTLRPTATAAGS